MEESPPGARPPAEFDRFADTYESVHAANVAVTGEAPEYFAIYKQRVLERLLGKDFGAPILDFGCGIGNLTRLLVHSFPKVHGYDPSTESIRLAKARTPGAAFFDDMETLPKDAYGAIVLANVLHHVPPKNRRRLMKELVALLERGGRIVVFEHNPYNPLTRRAVATCALDETAVLLYPSEVTALLAGAGLSEVLRDYIVFFPRALARMRPLEAKLRWLPLGAQICAWGIKRS